MSQNKFAKQSLTFHHLLLIPPPSHLLPTHLHLTLKLSHNINLNIPLISPPIHTLTQS
ncbi:IMP dehydrogenase, partial [Staphylococcus epidermidis]|uniref:IMP dehydrogenase n=1 Tax=Staphylococcus epidermidis TaxID=1282 RepID=UPI0016425A8D